MTLEFLFWALLVSTLISFWWRSDKIKSIAMAQIFQRCREQGLQPLDQSMVLKGVWPVRSVRGALTLRRRYQFEFTSNGEARYRGRAELHGNRIVSLDLDAHILPEERDLH